MDVKSRAESLAAPRRTLLVESSDLATTTLQALTPRKRGRKSKPVNPLVIN